MQTNNLVHMYVRYNLEHKGLDRLLQIGWHFKSL